MFLKQTALESLFSDTLNHHSNSNFLFSVTFYSYSIGNTPLSTLLYGVYFERVDSIEERNLVHRWSSLCAETQKYKHHSVRFTMLRTGYTCRDLSSPRHKITANIYYYAYKPHRAVSKRKMVERQIHEKWRLVSSSGRLPTRGWTLRLRQKAMRQTSDLHLCPLPKQWRVGRSVADDTASWGTHRHLAPPSNLTNSTTSALGHSQDSPIRPTSYALGPAAAIAVVERFRYPFIHPHPSYLLVRGCVVGDLRKAPRTVTQCPLLVRVTCHYFVHRGWSFAR